MFSQTSTWWINIIKTAGEKNERKKEMCWHFRTVSSYRKENFILDKGRIIICHLRSVTCKAEMSNPLCSWMSLFFPVFFFFHLTTYSRRGAPVLIPALQSHANLHLSKRRNRKITTWRLELWPHSARSPEHQRASPFPGCEIPQYFKHTLKFRSYFRAHRPQVYDPLILLIIDLRGRFAWKCNQTLGSLFVFYIFYSTLFLHLF